MTRPSHPRGLTLVELLVVIGMIGVLVALLLPAVQAAREAARRVQCKSQLKQFALGAITHEEQHRHFPTGGWGPKWIGDRDRGFGRDQTGGWLYNVLPFIEESALHDLPRDGRPGVITEEQLQGAEKLMGSVPAILNCPSRRPPVPYGQFIYRSRGRLVNGRAPELVGKSDYAINLGELPLGQPGPDSLEEGATTYFWVNDSLGYESAEYPEGTIPHGLFPNHLSGDPGIHGVSFNRSEVGVRHVTDGLSNTYLIGEKYMNPIEYFGPNLEQRIFNYGDELAWCSGANNSTARFGIYPPLQDRPGVASPGSYGSPHAAGFHMSFCDGSVRVIDYGIDPIVHLAYSNRRDGTVHGLGVELDE